MLTVTSIAAFAALAIAAPPQADERRSLFTVKEFPAFQVMVPREKSAWCSDTARVSIVGQSADQFTQNQPVIERIVGGVRAIMSFECPQATKLVLSGEVGGQPLYQASATAAGNWRLEGVELRTTEQLRMIADLDTISRCDDLASGPDDPEAMSQGVADDRLDGIAVVDACKKAIALDAETPRFRYQMARGLLAQGDVESAVEQLIPAGEAGHGGALATLGDIYLNGAGSIEADPATAKGLYERAVEAGYTPARTILAGFEDQTKAVAAAEAEEKAEQVRIAKEERAATVRQTAVAAPSRTGNALNPQGYERPDFMNAIFRGDYVNTGLNRRFTQIYLINMGKTMRQVCRGSFTITEIQGWERIVLSEVDTSPQAGGQAAMNMLEMLAGIASGNVNLGEMAANSAQVDAIPQMASEDAMTFIGRNNCGSPTFEKFTANMREAVK